jgi:hypothetical protein
MACFTTSDGLTRFSLATPHVAGLVCYLKSVFLLPRPADVSNKIAELATAGKLNLAGAPNTKNLLGYNGFA